MLAYTEDAHRLEVGLILHIPCGGLFGGRRPVPRLDLHLDGMHVAGAGDAHPAWKRMHEHISTELVLVWVASSVESVEILERHFPPRLPVPNHTTE